MENHSINGGLGNIVAEILSENAINISFKRLGIHEQFGEVSDLEYLTKVYSLGEESIIKALLYL